MNSLNIVIFQILIVIGNVIVNIIFKIYEEVRSNDDNYYFGDEDGDVQENVEHVYIEDTDKDNFQASQNRMSTKVAALGEKRKLTLSEEPSEPSRKSRRCRKVNSLFTDYVK